MVLSLEEKKHKPPRILIYGAQGRGKSTFGALSHKPVFIQTEDGLAGIDVPRFPLAKSYDAVCEQLKEIATLDHGYSTLVIDSIDWLEPLIWDKVCKQYGVDSIEKVEKGYGKGYVAALNVWRDYVAKLNYIRDVKNMTIIQVAHARIVRFENPETEPYDRYEIKLHKSASSLMMEHSDMVLFATDRVNIVKDDDNTKEGRARARSSDRVIYTTERPTALAKNRYGLPPEIPFDKEGRYWNVIASHIPFFKQVAQTKTGETKNE